MKVKFKHWDCELDLAKYRNNDRTCITLIDVEDGEVILFATTNVPEIPLEDDEVIIKDYSENEGVLDALILAKVISSPIRYVQQGYITFPICKLLI